MSHRTVTTWTCDRCDATRETEPNVEPPFWRHLMAERMTGMDGHKRSAVEGYGYVCPPCWDAFLAFLRNEAAGAVQPEEVAS